MNERRNLYQLYMDNGCKIGFFVTRNSWRAGSYAKVVKIDGVKDGTPIDGAPPYFTRYYPEDHAKVGKVWKRQVYLEAQWFDNGIYITESGGTYAWTLVTELNQGGKGTPTT